MEPASDLTLEGLTARVVQSSKLISDCIKQQNLPAMSFDVDGPGSFPVPPAFPDVQAARFALIEASDLLRKLALGAKENVEELACAHHGTSNLRTLQRLGVFEAVPLNGTISYTALAAKVGNQDVARLRRIIRFGITNGLLLEPSPEQVSHSSMSAEMAKDAEHAALVRHCVEDVYPAACREADWLSHHPESQGEPTEAGFNLAFDTDKKFFDFLASAPERDGNFAKAMTGMTKPGAMFDGAHVLRLFDWEGLGETTVVDVGGGRGQVCAVLAAAHPKLRFIVQDVAAVIGLAQDTVPKDLRPRVEFVPQDFFKPQPDLRSRGRVVYYMRYVLHDWSDKYCIKILRNIVEAMEDGGTILINDQVVPPMGSMNRHLDNLIRMIDMQMLVIGNAQERSVADFEKLLAETDPRLKLVKVHMAPGSPSSIVEVKLSAK